MNPILISKLEATLPQVSDFVENGVIKVSFFSKLWSSFLEYLPTLLLAIVVYIVGCIINKIIMSILSEIEYSDEVVNERSGPDLNFILAHIVLIVFTKKSSLNFS